MVLVDFTFLCARLAALFHDVGKATELFQDKLIKGKKEADLIRHEIASGFIFDEILDNYPDDIDWLSNLASNEIAKILDKAVTNGLNSLKNYISRYPTTSHEKKIKSDQVAGYVIRWLIVTHHRPLASKNPGLFNYDNHYNRQSKTPLSKIKQPRKIPKIISHQDWIQAVKECASELLILMSRPDFKKLSSKELLSGVYNYARPVVILADHAASSRPNFDNSNYPDAKSSNNTGQRVSVPQHNLDVHTETKLCFYGFIKANDLAPRVEKIPLKVLEDSSGKFAWQTASVLAIRDAAIKITDGFFGIVLAGTGRGKTIACSKIMHALDDNPRFAVCLPWRTLTYQTGSAYCDDMGFNTEDIFVKTGSPIMAALDTIEQNDQDEDEVSIYDDNNEGFPRDSNIQLPKLSGFFQDFVDQAHQNRQDNLTRYLGCPILVATIDSLMGVSAGFKTSRMEQALRLSTSDIVIDEIDSFDEKDQAAIARLIYMAGTYGKRVIIASATMPPATAESMYLAYTAGYQEYCMFHQIPYNMVCGWFPDEHHLVNVQEIKSGNDFRKNHNAIINNVVGELTSRPPSRQAEILKVSHCRNRNELFEEVWQGCLSQHKKFNISTGSGTNLSIGFVRFSRTKTVREFARFASLKNPSSTIQHKIICYHSRHMLVIRHQIESFLERVCNRKGDVGYGRLLDDQDVQKAIKEADGKDLMIVVVCSPILEIGRDYDFDWSIIDPSGLRSFVQAGGRLGRHSSTHNCITSLILDIPHLALEHQWVGETNRASYFYPGVEEDDNDLRQRWRLKDNNGNFISLVEDVFDMNTLSTAIDARDCLLEPNSFVNPIGRMEHDRLRDELIDSKFSVTKWCEGDFTIRSSNWHQAKCTFRYNSMKHLSVWRDGNGQWKRKFDFAKKAGNTNVFAASEGKEFLLQLDSHDIYLKLAQILDPSGKKTYYKELCGFEFQTDNDISLGIEYSDQLGGGKSS